jgi:hypothetical protein
VDGIIGDNYPVPDRMLVRVEQVVQDFLKQELYGIQPASGKCNYLTNGGSTTTFGKLVEIKGQLWLKKIIYDEYRMGH